MKWLVGLFLAWIVLRGRFGIYADLASKTPASGDLEKSKITPTGSLEALLDIMGN